MTYKPTIVYDQWGYAHVTTHGASLGVQVQWVDNGRNSDGGGGEYEEGYYWKLVLHEIQGGAYASNIAGHRYPPHVWYDVEKRILYQTVRLGRSALALYQDQTRSIKTNKGRAIQTELSGHSEYMAWEPQAWLQNIAEDVVAPQCTWVAQYGNGSIDLNNVPPPWPVPGSAFETAVQRMWGEAWRWFNGACTHANVGERNDHWDTGALDIWWIFKHAAMLIGGALVDEGIVIPTEDDDYMLRAYMVPNDDTVYIFNPATGLRRPLNDLVTDSHDHMACLNSMIEKGFCKPLVRFENKTADWDANYAIQVMYGNASPV